ncbi:hypothetical protein [Micromonospora carbonacea]|uniref:Uncharacterized protein n=1 Tax=Micromonospora carbonacea TaxID=47853 RepID=A0A7H8XP61_9ACTN|nr:hypothetical protein [Micromonospora carbonacea]MBB5825088.1 hypothetical protein [Micromonospora carbonacea]QLD26807.1 hypothetical protein HXZ27_23465 [Micromonospora carbonacea]
MQRRPGTAVRLAPLLVCALLLHVGLACRAPLDAVAVTVAPHPAVAPHAVAPAAVAAASPADPGIPVRATARSAAAPRAGVPPRTGRAGRVALEAYRLVTTLAAHTDQPPDPTVVPRFDGKACGSVSRSGRGNQGTDRRDPGPQAGAALPEAAVRRGSTADGRPATADAGPDPIRLRVLRC